MEPVPGGMPATEGRTARASDSEPFHDSQVVHPPHPSPRALTQDSPRGFMSVAEPSFPAPSPLHALPGAKWALFPLLPILHFPWCPEWVGGQGRAELFFVFEGAAAALGNDLRPSAEGTHTSKHLRADCPVIFLLNIFY